MDLDDYITEPEGDPILERVSKPITSAQDWVDYWRFLTEHSMNYHPEDDAHDVISGRTHEMPWSSEVADLLNTRSMEAYQLEWPAEVDGRTLTCPCDAAMYAEDPEHWDEQEAEYQRADQQRL